VIYSFLTLLYDYLGGEGAIINAINGMPINGTYATWTCCLSGTPFSLKTLRFCKKSTLQVRYFLLKTLHFLILKQEVF
jgi:hypothetical protein